MAKKEAGKILRALRVASIPVIVGSIIGMVLLVMAAIYADEAFSVECLSHIRMAAHAPAIEDAERHLDVAIAYVERHELIDGKTSILFHGPSDSVLLWYFRLRVVQQQLQNASELGVTTGERDIVLNRFRKSMMRLGAGSEVIFCPAGISRFPHNHAYFISAPLLIMLFLAGCIIHSGKPYVHSHSDW